MEYCLGFSIDHDDEEMNVVDAFVSWQASQSGTETGSRAGEWFVGPGAGFVRDDDGDDGGPTLRTFGYDNNRLYEIILSFFRFA